MSKVKHLIRQLASHAISKKGAEQNSNWKKLDVMEAPNLEVPGTPWNQFFIVDFAESDVDRFGHLPVIADAFARHRQQFPSIRKSSWAKRDGHIYMEVPLDGSVPADSIKSMIDDAHSIVWNKLNTESKLQIELGGMVYDENQFIDRLIDSHNLSQYRRAIHKTIRPAILLRTKKSSEAKIPLGATKIGGRPDLPAPTAWPTYRDGKPLAFLAQIDLAEISQFGTPIKGLPTAGLISIFSVWGWVKDGCRDPQTPRGDHDQTGWTVTVQTPADATLERVRTPRGGNSFKAAAVEPTSILSLPNHRFEPALAKLKWTDDLYQRFDEMQSSFRTAQMGHWLKESNPLASHHLLGGYALFQQEFPREWLAPGLAMFLQIGTDHKTEMQWGDGGELTFYANAKALAQGRLESIQGTCQGG